MKKGNEANHRGYAHKAENRMFGYRVENKLLGARYDGGKSPLAENSPESFDDMYWTVRRDANAIGKGESGHKPGPIVTEMLRLLGIHNPNEVYKWPYKKRMKLIKKMMRMADENADKALKKKIGGIEVVHDGSEIEGPYDSLESALEKGKNDDPVAWRDEDGLEVMTTIGTLRRVWNANCKGVTPRQFADGTVADTTIIKLCHRITRGLREAEANATARGVLWRKLQKWQREPLRLERPQGSSLHHFMAYDDIVANDVNAYADCQIVLVENDWGAAVPPIEGEWRVPFPLMCWEFRLSGVRVLAMTDVAQAKSMLVERVQQNRMYLLYGADGHWCVDGFEYELGHPTLPPGVLYGVPREDKEFRHAAKFCYDTIRAACVMLDAQVAHQERVAAPVKLAQRRAKEGRAPLRDHYVVRLLHEERRSYHRARSAGAMIGVAKTPQRGHWRKGTWVHFDDQDSGQVQYTNDGGFIVSKTWRRWHFAGDPKNIIHKEYRL